MKSRGKFQRISATCGMILSFLGTIFAQTPNPSPPAAPSANPIVFPAKGQSQQQMEKDKNECYVWAKQQSGYDPLAAGLQTPPPSSTAPQVVQQPAPSQPQGGAVRGGARGAAAGALIGAAAGNAGKGAAIGAASGGVVGGVRQRRDAQAQATAQQQQAYEQQAAINQQTSQQQAAQQQQIDAYKRAYSACMEGKGYTVK